MQAVPVERKPRVAPNGEPKKKKQQQENGVPAAGASGSGTKAERPVAAAAASACFLAVESYQSKERQRERDPSEMKCARWTGLATNARHVRCSRKRRTTKEITAGKQEERRSPFSSLTFSAIL